MSQNPVAPGPASIQVLMDTQHDAVFSRGRFASLFAAYRNHVQRWETLPEPPALAMMQQALAAASLHLSCRPHDEFTAWTLNLPSPPINFFVTADNAEGIITGRVITEGVKTAEHSRLFVEFRRSRGQHGESMVEVDGLEVLPVFEQYYLQSEQTRARLLELSSDEVLLVFGLPNVSESWITGLDREQALTCLGSNLQVVGERSFRFECGCNPQKILSALRSLFAGKSNELFLGEDQVQTFCPRCGRHWWITREDFFAGSRKMGVS